MENSMRGRAVLCFDLERRTAFFARNADAVLILFAEEITAVFAIAVDFSLLADVAENIYQHIGDMFVIIGILAVVFLDALKFLCGYLLIELLVRLLDSLANLIFLADKADIISRKTAWNSEKLTRKDGFSGDKEAVRIRAEYAGHSETHFAVGGIFYQQFASAAGAFELYPVAGEGKYADYGMNRSTAFGTAIGYRSFFWLNNHFFLRENYFLSIFSMPPM